MYAFDLNCSQMTSFLTTIKTYPFDVMVMLFVLRNNEWKEYQIITDDDDDDGDVWQDCFCAQIQWTDSHTHTRQNPFMMTPNGWRGRRKNHRSNLNLILYYCNAGWRNLYDAMTVLSRCIFSKLGRWWWLPVPIWLRYSSKKKFRDGAGTFDEKSS